MKSQVFSVLYLLIFAALILLHAGSANAAPDTKEAETKKNGPTIDDKALPKIEIKTKYGVMTLELFEDETPNTVANFINLTEKGFYNGLKFHRVIENFMIQGGDPTGTGAGGPGYEIDCEASKNTHKHERGVISMAHRGLNTGGSQFFITHVATPWLDGKHTVFGRVISGIEIVDKIQGGDTMDEVKVTSKRNHEYKPVTHASSR